MPRQKEVIISVVGDSIQVYPDPVYISTRNIEEIMWRCYDGDAEVTFKRDTPFYGRSFRATRGGAACSGSARPGTARETPYEYAVEVTLPGGKVIPSIDPRVLVE